MSYTKYIPKGPETVRVIIIVVVATVLGVTGYLVNRLGKYKR